MTEKRGRPESEDIRKVLCEVVDGVVYSDRCLYKLSKVIEGNKTCENCILRRLEKIESRGVIVPDVGEKKRGKAKRVRRARKKISLAGLSGIPKEGKEAIEDASQIDKQMYSVQNLVNVLGKSERRIRELAQEGKIPAHKVGKVWHFPKKEMDRWLSEKRGETRSTLRSEEIQELNPKEESELSAGVHGNSDSNFDQERSNLPIDKTSRIPVDPFYPPEGAEKEN